MVVVFDTKNSNSVSDYVFVTVGPVYQCLLVRTKRSSRAIWIVSVYTAHNSALSCKPPVHEDDCNSSTYAIKYPGDLDTIIANSEFR